MVICNDDRSPRFASKAIDPSSEEGLREFVKSMVKKSLFVGTFTEKRLVSNLNSYLDVVKIADDEHKLIENLIIVKNRIENYYLTKKWIGFTTPATIGAPTGYSLWVNLKQEIFGTYWFEIRNVEFLANAVIFKLKAIKQVEEFNNKPNVANKDQNKLPELKEMFNENLKYFVTQTASFKNIGNAIVFLVLLLATLCTGAVHFSKFALEYALKLIDKLDKLLRTLTPFCIACLDMVNRAIAGFYTLIALLWVNRHKQNAYNVQPVKNTNRMIGYGAQYEQHYRNQNYYTKGPTITPLD